MPPSRPRPENYRDIRIEDVDRAILHWWDRTVDAHVTLPGERRHKVPVIFSNKERWVSAKEDMAPRDKDGKIILPAISITRTGLDPTNGMLALGSNVPTLQISRRVSPKTNVLQSNREALPISQRGPDRVVYEVATIPFPFNGTAPYEVVIHCSFMQHMNEILEKVISEMEFYDVPCFVAPMRAENRPEPLENPLTSEREPSEDAPFERRDLMDGYYVCGYFDDAVSSDGNIDEFTDQERVFRYNSRFTVPVFLQLNPEGKKEAVQVEQTAFRLDFGRERAHFSDDEGEIELLFSSPWPTISEKLRRR